MKAARGKNAVRRSERLFIAKAEMAHHLTVDTRTIDEWVRKGDWPPPHSRPGQNVSLWLRKHWDAFVSSRRWPSEAFPKAEGQGG